MKIKGETETFIRSLRQGGCRVEETEEGLLKVYMPPGLQRDGLFRIAARENIQIRHFVRSQTSLEDLFAKTVGVD
jgi:hypothetical protein